MTESTCMGEAPMVAKYLKIADYGWTVYSAGTLDYESFSSICASTHADALHHGFSGDLTQWIKEVYAAGERAKHLNRLRRPRKYIV
jgi:hypothetical protein